MKSSQEKKMNDKKINDEMIGMDDRICSCSSIVGDIIIAKNKVQSIKEPLRKIQSENDQKQYEK